MISLITAATSMAFIKMGKAAGGVAGIFGVLFGGALLHAPEDEYAFAINPDEMVRGDVRLAVGVTDVDIRL